MPNKQKQSHQSDQQKNEQGKNATHTSQQKQTGNPRNDNETQPEELPGHNDDSKKTIRETPRMNNSL